MLVPSDEGSEFPAVPVCEGLLVVPEAEGSPAVFDIWGSAVDSGGGESSTVTVCGVEGSLLSGTVGLFATLLGQHSTSFGPGQ